MIGRLYEAVVDCPDPKALADLNKAEAEILALGARQLRDGDTSRVYADPAGHPFCVSLDDPSAP